MVCAINSAQFTPKTRFTKKGNRYESTNCNKWIGLATGALIKTWWSQDVDFYKSSKFNFEGFQGRFSSLSKLKEASLKTKCIAKALFPPIYLAGIGFMLGSFLDGAINKIKAYQADKKALKD